MCGLVGVITKKRNGFAKDQVDAFDNLLYIDALRGQDSTGIMVLDRNGDIDVAKEASASYDFRKRTEYKDLLAKGFRSGVAMLGHNRAATKGSIIDANAHPFSVDDRITLMHNGTLWGDHKKLANVEVDSHAIAHTIHNHGDDVQAALQEISGAYALIWHDLKNQTLNFVRNSQRPLHWVETTDGWLWASEANMLSWILARYSLKTEGNIAMLPEGTLTTFTLEDAAWTVDSKKITLERPKVYSSSAWGGDEYYMHPRSPLNRPDYSRVEAEDAAAATKPPTILDRVRLSQVPPTRQSTVEDDIAVKHKLAMPCLKYITIAETIPDTSNIIGRCIDHTYVAPNGPEHGYFLYALLEDEPDLLLRTYLPSTFDETTLLDLTLNNRRCEFRVFSRQWRAFSDKTIPEGYGIFMANGMTEIVESITV